MTDRNFFYKPGADAYTSPVLVGCVANKIVADDDIAANFPFILRLVRKVGFFSFLRKYACKNCGATYIIKNIPGYRAVLGTLIIIQSSGGHMFKTAVLKTDVCRVGYLHSG